MLRKVFLAVTFLAVLGAAGLTMPTQAQAWRWGGYDGGYFGPRAYSTFYGPAYPRYYGGYSPRYYGGYYRGPVRTYYGPTYYGSPYSYGYGGPSYYYAPTPRVAFRIGY